MLFSKHLRQNHLPFTQSETYEKNYKMTLPSASKTTASVVDLLASNAMKSYFLAITFAFYIKQIDTWMSLKRSIAATF